MDSRRLFKLITRRWWLIAVVSVAGAAAAFLLTDRQNSAIEETHQATAPVLILQTHSESDDAYETRLRSLESGARLALANQISGSDTLSIEASAGLKRLEFEARAPTAAEAVVLAERLRDSYESAEPGADTVGLLQEELASLEVEIRTLRAERSALTAGTPIDPGVAAELALMEAQLSSLRQQAAALSLGVAVSELGTAPDEFGNPRPVEDVRQELASVDLVILRLENEYEELRSANPTAEPTVPDENLDLLVLDQKIRDAESLYIGNSLTIEELLGGGGTSLFRTETDVVNVTPLPASSRRAGLLGLLLGGALAIGMLIATDRMRRPILGIEDDLAVPVLANVDPMRPGAFEDRAWYPSADDARRSDVQTLRAALESTASRGTASIALSGIGASEAAVQELAADLATSIAAADRKVLLVDAVFANPSGLPEYGASGPTLADIVTRQPTSDDAWAELKQMLDERDEVVPELLALRAGRLDGDPVDAVARRRFRELLEVAREFVEVIIVAAPAWGDSATDVLTQRLENFALVGRVGVTPAVDVEDAANELATRNAEALGLVLLRRRTRVRATIREQRIRRGRNRVRIEPTAATLVQSSSPDEPEGYPEPPEVPTDAFEGRPQDVATEDDAPAMVPAEDEAAAIGPAVATVGAAFGPEQTEELPAEGIEPPIGTAGLRNDGSAPSFLEPVSQGLRDDDAAPPDPAPAVPETGFAEESERAIRPEIVSPTAPMAALGSVEHISEIHIAEDGHDVVDVVATAAVTAPPDETAGEGNEAPLEVPVAPTVDGTHSSAASADGSRSDERPVAATAQPEMTPQDRFAQAEALSPPTSPPEAHSQVDESAAFEPQPPAVVDAPVAATPDGVVEDPPNAEGAAVSGEAESDGTGRRLPSLISWTRRAKRSRSGRSGDGGARRWTTPLESGEIYLIEQFSELLRHGVDRPRFYGHPSGALLMFPTQLTEAGSSMLYNAVFKDAPARSEELEDSIARVLSVESTHTKRQHADGDIDWWYETLGLESDSTKQEELTAALDTWLRKRLMTALTSLRLDDFAWHLASPEGTFELIVDAQTFNAARALSLRAGAVGRYLERLRISLWRESKEAPQAAAIVREALVDVEAFDTGLLKLSETHRTQPFTRDQLEDAGVLKRDAHVRP